ncbi:MAG: alpha-glucosidase domain-containing protein, partial [Candidatus Ventricola sp.]|nr:alpha-glucosidase domain-containing protein [Candidatus Ventricola sp.]
MKGVTVTMKICSRFAGMETKDGCYLVHTDNADLKIVFVTDEIVRVRASFDKELAEESYILMTTAWEDRLDPLFEGERTRVAPVMPAVEETDSTITFATAAVKLVLEKNPLCLALFNAEGVELYRTISGSPFILDSNNRVVSRARMEEEDCFYGFGEKAGLLNKNKTFLRERATDAMGYDAEKMDTLYKHIPFYIR